MLPHLGPIMASAPVRHDLVGSLDVAAFPPLYGRQIPRSGNSILSSAVLCWANAKGFAMARRCDLTGKGAQVGHTVSHSNRKAKRRFMPNLVNVTLISDTLERSVRLRISTHALKSVDHRGGLDAFLAKASDDELSPKALEIKRQVAKKRSEATAV